MPKIADAWVEIDAKKQKYQQAIQKVKRDTNTTLKSMQGKWDKYGKSIKRAGKIITGFGLAAIGSITALALHTAKLGDEFHKMSLRIGESAARLSALKHAADISGVSMNEVETGLRRLSQNMNDFRNGTGEAAETFEALGITVTDTDGQLRSSIDVMVDVSDALNKLGSESEKTAFSQELLGRSGSRLLPLLKEGSVGIKRLMMEAKRLGLVIDDKAAAAAAEFNDRLTELKSSLRATAFQIGNALLPVLQPLIEQLTEVVGKVAKWVEANPKLTEKIAKFALVIGGLMAAGGPLLMFAPAVMSAVTAVKALGIALVALPALGPIAAGLLAIGAAVGVVAYQWRQFKKELETKAAQSMNKKAIKGAASAMEELMLATGRAKEEFVFFESQLKSTESSLARLAAIQDILKDKILVTDAVFGEIAKNLGATDGYISVTQAAEAVTKKMGASTRQVAASTGTLKRELQGLANLYNSGELWFLNPRQGGGPRQPPAAEHTNALLEGYRKARKDAKEVSGILSGLSGFRPSGTELSPTATEGIFAGMVGAVSGAKEKMDGFREEEMEKWKGFGKAIAGGFNMAGEASEAWKNQTQGLREAQLEKWRGFANELQPILENLFTNLLSGNTKSLWENFWEDIKQMIIRKLAQAFASQMLTGMLPGLVGGAAGGAGLGSILGGLGGGAALLAGLGPALPLIAGIGGAALLMDRMTGDSSGGASRGYSGETQVNVYGQDIANLDEERLRKTVEQRIVPMLKQAQADGLV